MTPRSLVLTASLWEATLAAFAPYRQRQVEGGCFWYGARQGDAARVGIPKQVNRPQDFEIAAEALATLNVLVPEDLVVVAQIHSHPGIDTTHSPRDDQLVVSRKVFSLVLPAYAALPCDLASVGVHVHDGLRWVKLQPREAPRRLTIEATEETITGPRVVDAR